MMSRKKITIIGAGGFGRELLSLLEDCNRDKPQYDILGFIVQKQYAQPGEVVNGYPVLGDFDWFDKSYRDVYAICAVGAPQDRLRLAKYAVSRGVKFCSVIHPLASVGKWVKIGMGSVISAGSILTVQVRVDNHVYINLDCTISHDVVIQDYVTVSPGTHISGNVAVCEGSFIGTGANIIQKVHIGPWSVIGAGSVVIRDVPANTTVVGNPGKVIKEREIGWYLR